MPAFIDLTGQRFNRLTVLCRGKNQGRSTTWYCQCDCGNRTTVQACALKKGTTKSCGCYTKDRVREMNTTHGLSKERLYHIWASIIDRCCNPQHPYYKDYGGRGIKICEEWRHDYQAFHDWAYANGYDEAAPKWKCTIDRIDVDGDYRPENCRWVDMKTQRHNRRDSRKDG